MMTFLSTEGALKTYFCICHLTKLFPPSSLKMTSVKRLCDNVDEQQPPRSRARWEDDAATQPEPDVPEPAYGSQETASPPLEEEQAQPAAAAEEERAEPAEEEQVQPAEEEQVQPAEEEEPVATALLNGDHDEDATDVRCLVIVCHIEGKRPKIIELARNRLNAPEFDLLASRAMSFVSCGATIFGHDAVWHEVDTDYGVRIHTMLRNTVKATEGLDYVKISGLCMLPRTIVGVYTFDCLKN
jgi:hypothetical protein